MPGMAPALWPGVASRAEARGRPRPLGAGRATRTTPPQRPGLRRRCEIAFSQHDARAWVVPRWPLEAPVDGARALSEDVVVAAFFLGAAHPGLRPLRGNAFLARVAACVGTRREGDYRDGEDAGQGHNPACHDIPPNTQY